MQGLDNKYTMGFCHKKKKKEKKKSKVKVKALGYLASWLKHQVGHHVPHCVGSGFQLPANITLGSNSDGSSDWALPRHAGDPGRVPGPWLHGGPLEREMARGLLLSIHES